MIFNWMYALCALLGVALGVEIGYIATKHRTDKAAEEAAAALREYQTAVMEKGDRLLNRWGETLELLEGITKVNTQLIEQNGKRRG